MDRSTPEVMTTRSLVQQFELISEFRSGEFFWIDSIRPLSTQSLCFASTVRALLAALRSEKTSVVVTSPLILEICNQVVEQHPSVGILLAPSPRSAFLEFYTSFTERSASPQFDCGVHESVEIASTAVVHPTATIGAGTQIRDFAYVGPNCRVGERCTIDVGARVGVDGLMQAEDWMGPRSIPHLGSVTIGADSVIQAGATVVRSFYRSPTSIEDGCVIGINSVVGHGSRVEANCTVAGGVTVGGLSRLSSGTFIPLKVTILPNVTIDESVTRQAGAVIPSRVSRQGGSVV
jgi:carbonic anhydrase/acetyltransferase-like protein (isoleucine patch superfamily)